MEFANMKNNLATFLRTFCALILLLIVICSCETKPGETSSKIVRISPRSPESEIRATILTYTPVGSSVEDVLKFVRARLTHVNRGPDYYDKPNHRIMILLGRYGLARETYVTWKFDDQNKLVELFVEKYRDS